MHPAAPCLKGGRPWGNNAPDPPKQGKARAGRRGAATTKEGYVLPREALESVQGCGQQPAGGWGAVCRRLPSDLQPNAAAAARPPLVTAAGNTGPGPPRPPRSTRNVDGPNPQAAPTERRLTRWWAASELHVIAPLYNSRPLVGEGLDRNGGQWRCPACKGRNVEACQRLSCPWEGPEGGSPPWGSLGLYRLLLPMVWGGRGSVYLGRHHSSGVTAAPGMGAGKGIARLAGSRLVGVSWVVHGHVGRGRAGACHGVCPCLADALPRPVHRHHVHLQQASPGISMCCGGHAGNGVGGGGRVHAMQLHAHWDTW